VAAEREGGEKRKKKMEKTKFYLGPDPEQGRIRPFRAHSPGGEGGKTGVISNGGEGGEGTEKK